MLNPVIGHLFDRLPRTKEYPMDIFVSLLKQSGR